MQSFNAHVFGLESAIQPFDAHDFVLKVPCSRLMIIYLFLRVP